ncbi:MAG: tetratricopeptide repeat protein [Bacteroidota bacterium]
MDQITEENEAYVDLLNQLGFEYWTVSSSEAEEYGRTALDIAERIGYSDGAAFAYRVMGVAHWVRGSYTQGLSLLFEARDRYRDLGDTLGMANCTMNIALIYTDQRDYARALDDLIQALGAFEDLGATDRVATTLTKMGSVYTEQGDYNKAFSHLMRALQLHEQGQFLYGIAEVNNRVALLFERQEEHTLALEYAERSLAISEQIGDKEGTANNLELLGKILLGRGEYAKAKMYLLRGEQMALELGANKVLRDIYHVLRDVYREEENYPQAYEYFLKYTTLRDEVFNEEVSIQMANLQTERELAVQQKELDMARMERDLNAASAQYSQTMQIVFGVGLLLVVILSILAILFLRIQLRRKQALLVKNAELSKTKASLQTVELENAQLKASELQRELDYKNRELTAYTLNFAQKNQLIEDLREQLTQLKPSDANQQKQVKQLRSMVNNTRNVDRDWEDFRLHFENVHPHFFRQLKAAHPDLSNGEQKLCSLIRLNLSMKETAAILGISPNSVKTARYRLRNKLKLETQDNLMDYLMQYDSETINS